MLVVIDHPTRIGSTSALRAAMATAAALDALDALRRRQLLWRLKVATAARLIVTEPRESLVKLSEVISFVYLSWPKYSD